ncbi:Polyketide cyclase / dehydrase and lipid transport protein [Melia azedarach]|uniref:Polyketide cyclase / dehydrase and lipid transport protein n=1 Tax=Melia azedarach TaxID=155640 RepID=A0ACC1YW90_MELAZ|nr:Polyketide cyclase / dehydrase and lipid transport protein [Melia azedarach]
MPLDYQGASITVSQEEASKPLSGTGDGVLIQIEKLGNNSRRIRSQIEIDASLDTVWNIMTDYENLTDVFPALTVSQVVEKKDNYVRIFQIGQQKVLGIKLHAKGVLDCYEKDIEIFPTGKKRDIEFKLIEGDFHLFEGKWSVQQLNIGKREDSDCSSSQNFQTTLSYSLDVRPKVRFPLGLLEGPFCNEIKSNLSGIREAAMKVIKEH